MSSDVSTLDDEDVPEWFTIQDAPSISKHGLRTYTDDAVYIADGNPPLHNEEALARRRLCDGSDVGPGRVEMVRLNSLIDGVTVGAQIALKPQQVLRSLIVQAADGGVIEWRNVVVLRAEHAVTPMTTGRLHWTTQLYIKTHGAPTYRAGSKEATK